MSQIAQLFQYAMPAAPGANTAQLNPVFADRVQDLQQDAQDAGIPSTLISGYRGNALQAQLRAKYENGTGGMAAPPGQSYHNYGNAADIITSDPGQQSALTAMAAEPWRGIYPGANFGDYDHYQIAGPINSGSPALATIERAAPSGPPPTPGSLAAYAALKNAGQPTPVSAYADGPNAASGNTMNPSTGRPVPTMAPDFSGVAPAAPTQAAAPVAAATNTPAPASAPQPPATNWGAMFQGIAPQAPVAPPAPPPRDIMPPTIDPRVLAQLLVAGLPKNLVLAG